MSDYLHDPKKFASTGLQLRLPVDLIPPTQYGRLTNGLPVIEGELRCREGMTEVGNVSEIAFINQFPSANVIASIANTLFPNGFIPGDALTITIYAVNTANAGQIALGAYPVTMLAAISPTQFSFTPAISVTPVVNTNIFVQATAQSSNDLNILPNTIVTNLFRLNEALVGSSSERIAAMNGRVFKAHLPAGNVFTELVGPIGPGTQTPTQQTGFSGGPMAIISFQFNLDTATWAIFADGQLMYKYRPGIAGSQLEFVPLGNDFPTAMAIASQGGTGNLNSTGGTGYDWRYTYVDGLALTESNPSPIMLTPGSTTQLSAVSFTNPYLSGTTAFGSVTTSGGSGTISIVGGNGSNVTGTSTCAWINFTVPAGIIDAQTLLITLSGSLIASNDAQSGGGGTLSVLYSWDAGVTFQTLFSQGGGAPSGGGTTNLSFPSKQYSVIIPSSISPANLIVQGVVNATAGGNFGHTASVTATLTITGISVTATVEASVNALSLVNKIAQVCVQPPKDKWQTFINLYRRGGSLPDTWRFVSQSQVSALSAGVCVSGALEIDDNVSDTTLSTQQIIQLDNDQPVTSVNKLNVPLSFIWGPVGTDARVLGIGDPARPESVYFSKPGNADAWPPENWLIVSDPGTPMIAGCAYNTRNFAFSRENIFELVEGLGTGTVYTPFRTPSAHGLFCKTGLCVGPAMYFISKDGIYQSTGGQDMSIVENDIKPLFPTYDTPGQAIEGYEAIDYTQPDAMRLRYHNDEVYFCYIGTTTGTRQTLIYDILKKRWRSMDCSTGISEVYSEPNTVSSLLYGMDSGAIYQAGGTLDPIELDTIENVGWTAVAASTPFTAGTWYMRLVRYTNAGAVAISYEASLVLSNALGIQVTVPNASAGTLKWRVYFGFGNPGGESNFLEFLESAVPVNRTFLITVLGTSGTPPTQNASPQIAVDIRTGAHDQGIPLNQKQYGNVIFDLDPGGATANAPVTITPLINGETASEAAIVVTGSGRQQVPLDLSDYFAFNTEYEIQWLNSDPATGLPITPVLYQYDTLFFIEPVQVTHWQSQPTSFAFPGFVHVRDGYIAIRSTAPVTLSMTFDTQQGEVTQTFTLPSTNGERLKLYVQFDVNKGLLYRFSLDSVDGVTSFRIYEADIEFRVKPWLSLLGYSIQRVVGGEASA